MPADAGADTGASVRAVAGAVAGAVLAAGSGTRMGQPKAELLVDGARLVDRAVLAAHEGGCHPVFVVVRAGTEVPGAHVVVNPEPDRGMRSSLALAVEGAADAEALAVLLVDAPGVGARAIARTVQAWTPGRVAVACYDGVRGHPIVMAPAQWRAALELADADEGARRYLRTRPELVDEVAADGNPADLDTPDDLSRWQAANPR